MEAAGRFTGSLSNSGETIALQLPAPSDANILNFLYDPTWEPATSTGYPLTVIDQINTRPGDWDEKTTWSASSVLYGTPGNEGPPTITSSLNGSTIAGDAFQYQITATKFPTSYDATGLPATLSLMVQDDADGDGMGDAWETLFGLNPASAADAAFDKDGDGQSNLAEWLAGTAPDNSDSRLVVLSETAIGTNVAIVWSSVVGKRYRVLTCIDLAAGSWTNLTSVPIVATGLTTTWTHANALADSARYYRIEIVP